jgi:WD40 repeat protein
VSPNGQWLAVEQRLGFRSYVYVYAVATGRLVVRLTTPLKVLYCLRVSPDSHWLILTAHRSDQNAITVFDTRDWQLIHDIRFQSTGEDVAVATVDPASRLLATAGSVENSIRIWHLLTGRLVGRCSGGVAQPNIVWSPDSRTLVTYGGLRFWSTTVFRELAVLPIGGDYKPLGFTADGRALVTMNSDHHVKTWSPPTLAEIDGQAARR